MSRNDCLVFESMLKYPYSKNVTQISRDVDLLRTTVKNVLLRLEKRKLVIKTSTKKRYLWRYRPGLKNSQKTCVMPHPYQNRERGRQYRSHPQNHIKIAHLPEIV